MHACSLPFLLQQLLWLVAPFGPVPAFSEQTHPSIGLDLVLFLHQRQYHRPSRVDSAIHLIRPSLRPFHCWVSSYLAHLGGILHSRPSRTMIQEAHSYFSCLFDQTFFHCRFLGYQSVDDYCSRKPLCLPICILWFHRAGHDRTSGHSRTPGYNEMEVLNDALLCRLGRRKCMACHDAWEPSK